MKLRLKLHNLRIDDVMIWSEHRYFIGAKIVNLKCRVFGSKTGPFSTVQVCCVLTPVATVRIKVEPEPEPNQEFGTMANTSKTIFVSFSVFLAMQRVEYNMVRQEKSDERCETGCKVIYLCVAAYESVWEDTVAHVDVVI